MKKVFILLFIFFSYFLQAQNFAKAWEPLQKRIDKGESFSNEELNLFLKKHEKELESNKIEKSILYDYLGANAFKEEKYPEAIAFFEKAIQTTKEINDTIYRAFYYFDLACLYSHVGYYSYAEPLFLKSLPTLAAVYGQSSLQYTLRFKILTEMYVEMGKYNEAKQYNDALLYYFKTLRGEKDRDYILCLNNDARISQGFGEYKKSIETYHHILDLHQHIQPFDTSGYITILNNISEVYRQISDFDKAINYLSEAVALYQKSKNRDQLMLATIYNNYGLSYKALGNYQQAEESFDNCMAVYKKLKLDYLPEYTNSLSNKADLYRLLGRYKQAADLLAEVIEIRKNTLGTDHENYANAISNLGLVYFDMANYKEAEPYFIEAKSIYKTKLGEYHPYYANCLNSLSGIYSHLHRFKEAEEMKLRALEIMKEMLGENNERYAYFLAGTASLYQKTGNYEKAIAYLEKSNAILKNKFGQKHIGYIDGIFLLAEYKLLVKDFKTAKILYNQSLDTYCKQFGSFFESMSEDEQNAYYHLLENRFDSYNSFVFSYINSFPKESHNELLTQCFNYQLFIKSLPLSKNINARRLIVSSNDTALISKYNEWLNIKQSLSGTFRDLDFKTNYWNEAEMENKANKLEQEIKKRTNVFVKSNSYSITDIQSKLNPNEAAISILRKQEPVNDFVFKTEYVALIVKNNSVAPIAIQFPNSDLFEKDFIHYYQEKIENKSEDTKSYERFWKPVMTQLKGINKIYLSNDGIYHQLNLYTLKNPTNNTFLIDELSIVSLPNLSVIMENTTGNTNKTADLYGNPDYEFDFTKNKTSVKTSEAVAKNRFGFTELPPLPGTQTEIDNISSALNGNRWKSNIYVKEKATENQLKKTHSPKVLHIATHGFFLKDVEEMEDPSILGFETGKLISNPLLRSGIMMAGASVVARDSLNRHQEQDGIFTAYEASLLNLTNTDLVVLSACETGLGVDMNNQGVFGLQRAFYIAGAKKLIMSLWAVDDEATQILMSEFYTNWAANPVQENIATSFKKAQLTVRNKYTHPYYWGAFVLLGK